MSKLSIGLGEIKKKFYSLTKGVRMLIIILLSIVVISLLSLLFISSTNKYQILFSNLDPVDAQIIIEKLNNEKIEMKIDGNTILVPKEKVDELRLSLASEITTGSKGYELMDTGSSFGMSDEEFQIKKIRMQQGELEKTIKSFPQIEDARVHITAAKDSVFVENKEPGKAAVYLKISTGQKLSNDQISSIVALVSGSVQNIPKENVEVIDNNMTLLSKNIGTDDVYSYSESVENQQSVVKKYENELSKRVVELLEPMFGKGKVNVAIHAELDFDAKQTNQLIVDPNTVILSEEIKKEENTDTNNSTSNSPVDNNMGNTIDTTNGTVTSSKEEEVRNYEVGKTETTTISATGQVKRLTASVVIDANLDNLTQRNVENLVATAIGLNLERNDKLNVVGVTFETENNNINSSIFDEMENDKTNKNLPIYIGAGVLAVIILIVVILIFARRNEDEYEYDYDSYNTESKIIMNEKPIETETKVKEIDDIELDEKAQLEIAVKKYAQEKPNQVADIIKSWLTEK